VHRSPALYLLNLDRFMLPSRITENMLLPESLRKLGCARYPRQALLQGYVGRRGSGDPHSRRKPKHSVLAGENNRQSLQRRRIEQGDFVRKDLARSPYW